MVQVRINHTWGLLGAHRRASSHILQTLCIYGFSCLLCVLLFDHFLFFAGLAWSFQQMLLLLQLFNLLLYFFILLCLDLFLVLCFHKFFQFLELFLFLLIHLSLNLKNANNDNKENTAVEPAIIWFFGRVCLLWILLHPFLLWIINNKAQ